MRVLVLGDLHLGQDGFRARPHPSWERHDAVLTVGDVAHSRVTVEEGGPRREEVVGVDAAREFYAELGELDVPAAAVPGNHDHDHHARLVADTGVENLHRATTDIDGWRVFGVGSERFDEGPEVRYDSDAVPDSEDADAWLAAALERAADGDSEPRATLRERVSEFDRQFDTYSERVATLRSLVSGSDRTGTVGAVHVPPFDTPLDRVEESVPRIGGRHWGSVALSNVLASHDVAFLACGHIHEGEGAATVAGTTCLNAGYRNAYSVTIEESGVELSRAEPPRT